MGLPSDGNVNSFLVAETGRIEKRFWRQCRASGIWTNQIRQTAFPLGMGLVLNKANYERSIPNTPFQWNTLALDNGTGNNANPVAQEIDPAWNTFQFQLQSGALNSNTLSIHDLALSLNTAEQVSKTFSNLQDNVRDIWEDRKQDEYDRICGHKITCVGSSTPPESGFNQAWSSTAPNAQINIEYLQYAWYRLMRDSGAEGDWGKLNYVMGQPCPMVFISPEGQTAIFQQNDAHRQDIRYSSQADRLSNPLATKYPRIHNPNMQDGSAFGHFQYGMNLRAPRYNMVNGAMSRVPFYDTTAAAIGNAANPGVAYRNASIEIAYVFHPAVMELCTYNPDPGYDNGVKFDAATFSGKFKWMNQRDNNLNIDGNLGYFRALLASASRPGLPNLGYAFAYQRCLNNWNTTSCLGS